MKLLKEEECAMNKNALTAGSLARTPQASMAGHLCVHARFVPIQ
jgi:hypothetical protein